MNATHYKFTLLQAMLASALALMPFPGAVAWAGEEAGLTGELQMVYPNEEPYERFIRFFGESVQTFISNTAFSHMRPAYRYAP